MDLRILAVLVPVALLWVYVRLRYARPEFPPLPTSPEDPLMIAALEQAAATRDRFLALLGAPRLHALVKLRFVSNTDQVEHLWAEVLSADGTDHLEVRLVTPPVTHVGTLDRLRRCSLEDVEDWEVRDAAGVIHGAFTQRAMFAIARRDGVVLPRKLRQIEREYVE